MYKALPTCKVFPNLLYYRGTYYINGYEKKIGRVSFPFVPFMALGLLITYILEIVVRI